MSSYLEKQQNAFTQNVTSAASKVANKRTFAAPVSAPSPAPSNTSTSSKTENKEQKRKREDKPVVYSQPADTGYGTDIGTQTTFVIEHLKRKDEDKTFREILEYLNLTNIPQNQKQKLSLYLRAHPAVRYTPDPKSDAFDRGYYRHRPKLPVRNREDLLRYLQKKVDAQGVTVRELKDGWPDCETAIDDLEQQHRVLVTRTLKDNHARMVWLNDPTLHHSVEPEFQLKWHKTELPSADDLVGKLTAAGLKPASEDPSKKIKAAAKPKVKKPKAPRKGGRTTNTHMQHLLKDYSHLKPGSH